MNMIRARIWAAFAALKNGNQRGAETALKAALEVEGRNLRA
jgi:hypothetical protein